VQIDWPREGATVPSPVRVTGDAAVFEANLPWRVVAEDDPSGGEGGPLMTDSRTITVE